MDTLTHTLAATLLSRVGLNRLTPHATLLLIAGANAPDLDVLTMLGGSGAFFEYHRGLSHSLVAIPVVALIVTVLIGLFWRKGFSWWRAYLLVCAGVTSNVLLNLTNSYGVRLLWPFSREWLHADFLAMFDIWIWLLFAFGLVAPWLSRLVSREIGAQSGSGRWMAIFVLSLAVCYGYGKHVLHERAVAVLDSHIYQAEIPLRVAAMPSPLNPFAWVGLVEGQGFLERHAELNLLQEFDPSSGQVFYKPEQVPQLKVFQPFLDFAQWPVWTKTSMAEPEGAVRVELSDLRFGPPGNSHFSISALVDSQGRAIAEPSRK